MVPFFSQILNMSMTASLVIGLVLLVRLLLRRAPKIYSYALWAVVLFRLLCPVSISGPVSVLEVSQPQVTTRENVSVVYYEAVEQAMEDSGWYAAGQLQEEAVSVQELEQKKTADTPSLLEISSYVWLAGLLAMVLYSVVNYLRLRRRLVGAVHWRGEIYLADHIATPFVLGLFLPKIYLPSGMPIQERRYIVAHERHHIKRLDHVIKLLAYSALCIHWFNPMVWLAFVFAGKDMEMSCDEAVIKRLGSQIRADYAQSLLRLASHHKIISGMPLAFGEGDTKDRVKNMAKWKRPRVWVSVLCVALCAVIGLVCALNPEEDVSLEEMTRMEGPTSCASDDLNYYIPEGCTHEMVDSLQLNDWQLKRALKEKKGLYPYNVVFKQGQTIVGGINRYYLPESYTPAHFDWIEDLGLWEFEDETLGHYGESGREYVWSLEFFTDLPEDVPDKQLRRHYFFLTKDNTMVNDLWFDMMEVDNSIYRQILDSCVVGGSSPKQVETTQMFLDFEATLPDSLVLLIDDSNTRKIATANTIVGGITAYEKPEFDLKFSSQYPMEEWNADEWLTAMGYVEDKTLAYMGGGSLYGDFERHYFSDVPEGQPITVDEHHTFFIRENYVYDVWLNMILVSEEVRDSILQSVSGKQQAEPTLPAEEMFTENFSSNDGTVNISIDANIPSDLGSVGCSIVKALPHYITEAEAEQAGRAVFGENAVFIKAAPILEKYNATEAQIQSAINRSRPYTTAESWEELVGSGGAKGSACEELAQETAKMIDYWQSQLSNFRCDYPEEESDFTYQNDAYSLHAPGNVSDEALAESGDSISTWVEMDGYSYNYKVTTRNKDDFKLNNIYVTLEWPVGYSELDRRVFRREHCAVEPNTEKVEAARQKASEILNNMGLGYWTVDEIHVEKHTFNHPDIPEYIIKVGAVPIIDGVPAIRWNQHGNINTKSEDKPVDNYYLSMAEFLFAADGTLMDMTLMSPMDELVLSRTNTGLDNESLLEIAVEELKKLNISDCGLDVVEMGYNPAPECDVEITNIRVGMARVRVEGRDATYQYLPALSLYGKSIYTFANGDKLDWAEQPTNLLTLNALDGSVITDMTNRIVLSSE
ncbi:MAG: hypothetical protein J6J12_07115 [Oscillospiraceae bacterium]|nr:hypothetical protein [Oscillospiraceae bacterium]